MAHKIDVAICSRNEGRELNDTVRSVLYTDPGDGVVVDRISVVDDASTDGSAAALNDIDGRRIRVIRNETRQGVAVSRNRAIADGRHMYFLVIDAHTRLQGGFAAPLVNALQSGAQVACGGLADYAPGSPWGFGHSWIPGNPLMEWKWLTEPTSPREIPFAPGGFFASTREWLATIGPLDEGFAWWGEEDVEWCLRTWSAGGRCVVAPDSRARTMGKVDAVGPGAGALIAYNKLRLMQLHVPPVYWEAVVGSLKRLYGFESGLAQSLLSDVKARQTSLDACTRKVPREVMFSELGLSAAFSK